MEKQEKITTKDLDALMAKKRNEDFHYMIWYGIPKDGGGLSKVRGITSCSPAAYGAFVGTCLWDLADCCGGATARAQAGLLKEIVDGFLKELDKESDDHNS